ncbi:MAG: hypothetical protein WAW07_08975, partial [Bacteroidales bacterium]
AVTSENLSKSLKIPVRLVLDILQDLSDSRLVAMIHEDEHQERLYQPAMDVSLLSVGYILNKLDRKGSDQQVFLDSPEYNAMTAMLDDFEKMIDGSESNILIKDL